MQAGTAAVSAPNPAAGHCWPRPPPETPGHSQASLSQSLMRSLLLSPGSWCAQGFVCALQGSVSPFCISSHSSLVGLMETSSKKAYTTPRSAAPRVPAPVAGHCLPVSLQETLKHSKAGLAQSLWGLWFLVCKFPSNSQLLNLRVLQVSHLSCCAPTNTHTATCNVFKYLI